MVDMAANQIEKCEVCGALELRSVLDLGLHPMCDDLVPLGDERQCREYPIEILYCDVCATAHQRFQVPKRELFPASYHYRSRFTADVLTGMQALVASCEERFGPLEGKAVLDVGCNDGSLLDFFRGRGANTLGIEPTDACKDAAAKGHGVICDFLSTESAAAIVARYGHPDFITFTNVFAHIEDLSGVVKALKSVMAPHTRVIIENHYLGAVLDGNQFDTFYHEHPRTYSLTSFTHIAQALGLTLLHAEFPSRYGGNIRVFLGPDDGQAFAHTDVIAREAGFGARFPMLRRNIEIWRERTSRQIQQLVATFGPLRAKAFPGRAAILVKLLGLNTNSISVVHEKPGSLKIGHYLPGTRIPIGSDDQLFALPDTSQPILNLAWHIPSEIRGYLKNNGYQGEVIDVLDRNTFASTDAHTVK